MNISEFKKFFPYLMENRITALVWGRHGIGKSSIVKQYAEDNGHWFFNFRLGNMADVGDLIGLADFEVDAKGNKVATRFIMPEAFKSCFDFCAKNPDKKAIIFLDEINRIPRQDMLAPVFQMALDYRLHTYEFPKNVYIIAAANPSTEDYVVIDLADKALLSRFCHIKLTPTIEEWFQYAEANKPDRDVVNFLKEQPGFLEEQTVDFKLDFVKPDRRAWEDRFVPLKNSLERDKVAMDYSVEELFQGIVGYAATTAFMTYLKKADKPYEALDVLDRYSKIQAKVKKLSEAENDVRMDILAITANNVTDYLIKNTEKLSDRRSKNLDAFIGDLPKEVARAFLEKTFVLEHVLESLDVEKITDRFEESLRKKA